MFRYWPRAVRIFGDLGRSDVLGPEPFGYTASRTLYNKSNRASERRNDLHNSVQHRIFGDPNRSDISGPEPDRARSVETASITLYSIGTRAVRIFGDQSNNNNNHNNSIINNKNTGIRASERRDGLHNSVQHQQQQQHQQQREQQQQQRQQQKKQ